MPKFLLNLSNNNNDSYELKVSKTYTKKNFNNLTGYDYEKYNGAIFMNDEEYKEMFNKNYYQSSIFMKDDKLSEQTMNELKDLDLFPSFARNRYEQQLSNIYEELKKVKRTNNLKDLYQK